MMFTFLTTLMTGTIVRGSGIRCIYCHNEISAEKFNRWRNDFDNIMGAYPLYCDECTDENKARGKKNE